MSQPSYRSTTWAAAVRTSSAGERRSPAVDNRRLRPQAVSLRDSLVESMDVDFPPTEEKPCVKQLAE